MPGCLDCSEQAPQKAAWPNADFIIGNPPFLGSKRMRAAFGDEYVHALRTAYGSDVEENADLVMYWWDRAAEFTLRGHCRAFGFITTNSITQNFNRRVVRRRLGQGLRIGFAIADHPWSDSESGAAVRIAMTVGSLAPEMGIAMRIVEESTEPESGRVHLEFESSRGDIRENLRVGPHIAGVRPLLSNRAVAGFGPRVPRPGIRVESGASGDHPPTPR